MLLAMSCNDVFVCSWPTQGRAAEYYRNMMPDVPIALCHHCNQFFHEEDYELAMITKKRCPFCRAPAPEDGGFDSGSSAYYPSERAAPKDRPGG